TDDRHPLFIRGGTQLAELGDGLAFVESFANVAAFVDSGRMLLVDAGGILHFRQVHEQLRAWTDAPLDVAVYTHGHVDHVWAVPLFEAEGSPVQVVAHENLPARFDRYDLTNGYNGTINQRQFQLAQPMFPSGFRYPDQTYRDHLEVRVGDLRVELHHDKGETDDGTWVWVPDRKVLCTGDLFIWAAPNCGNPQKVQRFPFEWAVALRKMASLGAELMLPGHGLPIAGRERIAAVLSDTAALLESLVEQALSLMNAGARLDELIHTVRVPEHLRDRPWLQPVYDDPEFVVRNLWRLYGGWYDGNPSHLQPAPESALATELAALAGGASVLADRAVTLAADGDLRLAGHLAEFAALAAPGDPGVLAVRRDVNLARLNSERSLMAHGIYRWAADESSRAIEQLESDSPNDGDH
ncbi:MAG: alkyl sulfatase dimerization domain-containing protein, partial [Actinomycetes bacterium]